MQQAASEAADAASAASGAGDAAGEQQLKQPSLWFKLCLRRTTNGRDRKITRLVYKSDAIYYA